MMIDSRDIREFVKAAEGKSYEEVLIMAEWEATSAERMLARRNEQ